MLKIVSGTMKKYISYCLFLFVLLLIDTNNLFAVPAVPYPITVTQPDGSTLQIRLKGDEFFRYKTTLDGYLLEENNEGFFVYAQLDDEKNIIATNVRATDNNSRTAGENQFLKTQKKNPDLTPVNQQMRVQRVAKSPSSEVQQKAFPLNGSPKSLVILVNFSNKSFVVANPQEAFTNMLNQEGYSENGGTGSARDYFISSSMGLFTPRFDVTGPYNLPNDMEYYGKNSGGDDVRPRQMIIDACRLAHDDGVDFSKYDTDSDGYVDNIFVFYAGYNEAEGGPANTIWPHRWALSPTLTLNGVKIYDYACTSELRGKNGSNMCGIGTFTHEFGHVLGLPDFSATNGASHQTLSDWSVMDGGAYLNDGRTPPAYSAYERFFLGWMTPVEINSPAYITLDTLTTSNTAYLISQSGSHNLIGSNPISKEFFMLENRQKTGWDSYLPNSGMLITRINYNATTWRTNEVNNIATTMGVNIMEADGIASEATLSGDPFPGKKNIRTYNPKLGNETDINKPLEQIEEIDGKIQFAFMGWRKQLATPVALAAKDVIPYSFTAVWQSVQEATAYYLTVYEQPTTTDTVFIEKNLLLEDTTYIFNNLYTKEYAYKIKACYRKLTADNVILYENISPYSNEIKVEMINIPTCCLLNVIRGQDGTMTIYIPSTKQPLYIYDTKGILFRKIDSDINSITIDDLPQNQIYIMKSGERWIKIFF